MRQKRSRLAVMLLPCLCLGATAYAVGQQCDVGNYLRDKVQISAGGPYQAKAGTPITLRGTYKIDGQAENTDKLKQIGLALEMYAHDHGSYPPAALLNSKGQRTVSWRVLILPYLGHKQLYQRFDLSKPWNDPANLPLLKEMPGIYRKAGAADGTTETGFAGLQGAGALFQDASKSLNGGRKAKGVSATEKIGAGPVGSAVHLPWSAPGDIDLSKLQLLGSSHGFAGQGCAATPLAFLDGSVYLIPNKTPAGSIVTWSLFLNNPTGNRCPCAPPASLDAGLRARWDLGQNAVARPAGWNVKFLAKQQGTYNVTVHAYDAFGGEFERSTKVEVR